MVTLAGQITIGALNWVSFVLVLIQGFLVGGDDTGKQIGDVLGSGNVFGEGDCPLHSWLTYGEARHSVRGSARTFGEPVSAADDF